MTISELIERLEALKAEHGDSVIVDRDGDAPELAHFLEMNGVPAMVVIL